MINDARYQDTTRLMTSYMGGRKRYPPHPMGIGRQDMFKKSFFAGVESALVINDYPPAEIETRHNSTISSNATIVALAK